VAANYAGNKEKGEGVVCEIKGKGVESFGIEGNVGEGEEVKGMIKEVVSEFGWLDVVVNKGGMSGDNLLMGMK
ncbi:SDR family NAD(P)-dependent oxidoreductase, partial [Staphylococcus haemolyticus]|uniref:SDR family NAD(P)-dependent oxidoreductase n=1 Tax=Staphylococcus haemolyticus TaxID=1283 RepID=UPI0011A7D465